MKTGIFSEAVNFEKAQNAVNFLKENNFDFQDVFPIIQTSKCTVDPKTLEVWQFGIKIDTSKCVDENDFKEKISEAKQLLDNLVG